MGTRGLTAVFFDGGYKIAQYGQWDHYPDGQGVVVLKFCQEWLTDPVKTSQFLSQLARCRFIGEDEAKAAVGKVHAHFGTTPDPMGFWPMGHSEYLHDELLPLLDRDHGSKILEFVATGVMTKEKTKFDDVNKWTDSMFTKQLDDLALQNDIEFSGDSLFCEWAYVVDLDANVLEVYKGFNKNPVSPENRFAKYLKDSGEYHPVVLVKRWSLDALPTEAEFIKTFKEKDEDADD